MSGDNLPGDDSTRLVLKVDVDTRVGLMEGVRRLADLMGELGVRASYYVAMGPDHSGRALKRVFRPGFLRKQMHSGAASAYGPITMLYGLLLPGPIIAQSAPRLMNRLINEGHEVGLHGWDHVYWHDYVRHLDPARTRRQLEQAAELFQRLTGLTPATFASPGWQINDAALLAMVEMGITHVSCTRGRAPFRPLVGGRALPLVELPTTLPSSDEVLGLPQVTPANLGRHLAGLVRPGALNVFTLHGEVEGRQMLPAFREFLRVLLDQGVSFITLLEAAQQAAQGFLPAEAIAWSTVPNRAGELAVQASVLAGAGGLA